VLVLAVDTSTPAVTAGVGWLTDAGNQVLTERVSVAGRAHGELLAPQIREVLQAADTAPAKLSAVVVGVGPGPFTGLRVGLVTAAALADALGIGAYPVCSLDSIGMQLNHSGLVLVATDARRREVYWAVYRGRQRVTGPAVGRPSELALPAGVEVAVGDGALRYADELGVPVLAEPRYPCVAGLLAVAAPQVLAGLAPGPLTPLYLRRPDVAQPHPVKAVLA
jgi:tRNA threonylcarbamoyl adenosine modification protein YeaZ